MKFRLIDSGFNTPSMNMAIDEALFISEWPVLRFYQWNPPALSIGNFQDISKINQEFCKNNNIEIERRITGGNAVLHDKELTYSFIIDEKKMPKSIIDSYKEISKGIITGLQLLGLRPIMNKDVKKEEKSQICFNDPSWYELLIDRKKIVGSAQKRAHGKILQHGAILMDIDIKKYANCFNDVTELMIFNMQNRITSLKAELKERIHLEKLKSALIQGFEQELDIEFIKSRPTADEMELAKELNKTKYSTDDWNFKL